MQELALPTSPFSSLASRLFRSLDLPRLIFAVIFLGLVLLIQLNDPDYYWHLSAGEIIWQSAALPAADPFSYTFGGRPWVAHEWLFELALYGLHQAAGDEGVRIGTAALASGTLYLSYRSASRFLPSTLALATMLLWLPALSVWFVPRPQLITYLLFSLMLHWLLDFRQRGATAPLVLMPPVMALWVNCHGAYLLGLLLPVLFLVGEGWRLRLTEAAEPGARQRLSCLARLTVLAILATAINPDAFACWLYPFQVLDMSYANSIIAEWRSPDFRSGYGRLFLLPLLAFVLAATYRRRRPDALESLLPLFFLAAGLSSVRHIPLAGLALIPATAQAFAETDWGERAQALLTRRAALGDLEYRLNWLLLAFLFGAFALLHPYQRGRQQDWLKGSLPVQAADYIEAHGLRGRLFNEYGEGGYLIHRLFPRLRVFVDGRADLYGDDFLREFQRIRNAGPGWDQAFDRWAVDIVVCQREAPLRALLLQRGDFRVVHDDAVHSVLLRKKTGTAAVDAGP